MAAPRSQRGFSLIEVLIAVLILGIGLLGAAAIQVLSLQNAGNSDYRTQATLLANEVAELARIEGDVSQLAASRTDSCPEDGSLVIWCSILARQLPDAEYRIEWSAGDRILDITLWWTEREMYQAANDDDNRPAGEVTSNYSYQVRML